MYDGLELGGADENLADLQPEDSDEEEEGQEVRPELSSEQQVCVCVCARPSL